MASQGRGRRGRPQGTPEAMGVAAAAITQAGAADSQGGIDDIRGIQDMGVGTKR